MNEEAFRGFLVFALLLAYAYIFYAFQHYFGINGTEWFVYLGFSLAGSGLMALVKGVIKG